MLKEYSGYILVVLTAILFIGLSVYKATSAIREAYSRVEEACTDSNVFRLRGNIYYCERIDCEES